MNKKLLAIAISAAIAAPVVASADTTVFGDARVRWFQTAASLDGMADDHKNDNTNSRVRVGVKSEMDGVEVNARIKATNQDHDQNMSPNTTATIAGDYGYMAVPVGPVKIAGGVMVGNFGNRLTYWDTRPHRVVFSTKFGDWNAALTFDKIDEGGTKISPTNFTAAGAYTDTSAEEKDVSSNKLILVGKIPTGKLSVMANSVKAGKTHTAPKTDMSGSEFIVAYAGQIGPVMVLGEYNSRGGDFYKDVDGDAQNAMYLHGIMKFGQVDVQLAYAATANGFTADDHFAPMAIVGRSQDTAIMDFGNGFKKMSVVALLAGMDVMPMMHVQIGYGQLTMQATDPAPESKGSALDLQASYKVSKSTTITGVYGNMKMDSDFGNFKYTVMGARMETKF